MIVNMIFFFEWEKGETDDFETHVAFAWLQKRNENVCIVRESNPGRPRGRRAFYHWTNDALRTDVISFLKYSKNRYIYLSTKKWKSPVKIIIFDCGGQKNGTEAILGPL